MSADKQINRAADTLITILRFPTAAAGWDGVNNYFQWKYSTALKAA